MINETPVTRIPEKVLTAAYRLDKYLHAYFLMLNRFGVVGFGTMNDMESASIILNRSRISHYTNERGVLWLSNIKRELHTIFNKKSNSNETRTIQKRNVKNNV